MGKPAKKDTQQRLRALRKEYERTKARIRQVGFISQGSLIRRRLPCGNPNCRCHKSPEKLHGPYDQLSWKDKGKTVSRFLSPQHARLYRQWIDNRRTLTAIIDEMQAISRKAADCIQSIGNGNTKAPKHRKASKRPRHKRT
jgi:hypothetical protein